MLTAIVLGDAVREFAGECGIEFADDKSAVIDHLNYDLNDNGKVKSEKKSSVSNKILIEYSSTLWSSLVQIICSRRSWSLAKRRRMRCLFCSEALGTYKAFSYLSRFPFPLKNDGRSRKSSTLGCAHCFIERLYCQSRWTISNRGRRCAIGVSFTIESLLVSRHGWQTYRVDFSPSSS